MFNSYLITISDRSSVKVNIGLCPENNLGVSLKNSIFANGRFAHEKRLCRAEYIAPEPMYLEKVKTRISIEISERRADDSSP